MSFRIKTIIGIALIQSVLLIILIANVMSFLVSSNDQQLQQRVEITSTLFAKAVKDPILSTDIASLQSFVDEVLQAPDILYVRISTPHHIFVEGGDPEILKNRHDPDTQLAVVNDKVFDTRVEIKEAGVLYGTVEMGISTQPIEAILSTAKVDAYWIAGIEILLVVIFSVFFGNYLNKQLQQLKIASEDISKTGPGVQVPVTGDNEISELASAFNQMSSTLALNHSRFSESMEQEEKKMSALANSNQAKNEAILNASLDAIITIDEKGEVIDFNKISESTFGWKYDEIVGKNLANYIIPEALRSAHHNGMERYLKTKVGPVLNQRIELTAQHKSGHNFPIEINIAPIETEKGLLFTAFIRDISARLQSESELLIAAQTFDSGNAIFITDADGLIIRSNQAFTKITGYEDTEVIGKSPNILASGQHSQEYYQEMWSTLLEKGQWSGEIYNRRKNGEIYPEYINISSVKNKAQETTHYIANFMDISEQKENEKSLRKARQQAEISNEAKSNFLASMSHEIRTPMNAILGILGLLKDTNLTEHQLKLVQTGRDSGELLLTIINDILDFTKMDIDKLKLENALFDLHQLLLSCNELLTNMANKKSISLKLSLSEDLPQFAQGDPTRLQQILINLINNAIKFTNHGSIQVTARVESQNDKQVIIRCQVKDTGIGIDKAHQDSLFDEFTMVDQTHSRKYEGTGLGLAICKRLVNLMGGEISVSSQLNIGSTFEFTAILDRADMTNNGQHQQLPLQNQLPAVNTRVLLAEDNPANQMVIKSILEFADLQVDLVANGYEAIEAVRNIPYDIVLMDISMPEMDGMTATGEIRKLPGDESNIPIVALTAHTLNGDKERFIAAGMNDYLSKPINRTATLNCIAHWTDNKAKTSKQAEQDKIQSDEDDCDNAYVCENVLQQLVRDTDATIVPELILMYIEDSKVRMKLIEEALEKQDISTLEFETHTIGSSAIAHGNSKLHQLARKIEHHCQKDETQQAMSEAKKLITVADESFRLLALRAEKGFA